MHSPSSFKFSGYKMWMKKIIGIGWKGRLFFIGILPWKKIEPSPYCKVKLQLLFSCSASSLSSTLVITDNFIPVKSPKNLLQTRLSNGLIFICISDFDKWIPERKGEKSENIIETLFSFLRKCFFLPQHDSHRYGNILVQTTHTCYWQSTTTTF